MLQCEVISGDNFTGLVLEHWLVDDIAMAIHLDPEHLVSFEPFENAVTKTKNSWLSTWWMDDGKDAVQLAKELKELDHCRQRKVLWMLPTRLLFRN